MEFKMRIFAPLVDKEASPTIEANSLKTMLDSVTQAMVERALKAIKGNKLKAADLIGMNRNTLSKYFKRLPHSTRIKFEKLNPFIKTEGERT